VSCRYFDVTKALTLKRQRWATSGSEKILGIIALLNLAADKGMRKGSLIPSVDIMMLFREPIKNRWKRFQGMLLIEWKNIFKMIK